MLDHVALGGFDDAVAVGAVEVHARRLRLERDGVVQVTQGARAVPRAGPEVAAEGPQHRGRGVELERPVEVASGASGVAELVTLLACLTLDQIPATAGFKKVDPEIALFPMVDRSNAHIQRALLNLIGFGGGLASMIIERRT